MKILLIKAVEDRHPYTLFVRALQTALTELGHVAVISDQSVHVAQGAATNVHLIAELEATPYDAVLSFSAFFGGAVMSNGVSWFDAHGVKFITWQLDHPIYTPQSLNPLVKGRYAIYANPNHLRYAQAVRLPGQGVTLLPGAEPPAGRTTDYRARRSPVVVAATWNGEPKRLWEELPDSAGKSLLQGVIERLLTDREASLLDAFNNTCADLDFAARLGDDPAFDAQMRGFLREPLTYVRNLDRLNVVRALADAGLPLTICGMGWEAALGERSNVTHLDYIPFESISELYGDAKVVVNLNAGNGGCERAVHAGLAGAAVASDYSQPLDGLFAEGAALASYDRRRPETAAETVGGLLESDAGERLAAMGQACVERAGLWRNRAQQMVDFAGAA